MLTISIVGDQKVIARMQARRERLIAAVTMTMRELAIGLVGYIQTKKLQTSPLHHRSGRLQGSIKQDVSNDGQKVLAKVYTNVEYAAIHEYGGTTKPHKIFPKNGKALAFMMGGNQIVVKSVNHPGSKMPERSFMRSSLAENKIKIQQSLQNTVRSVMREP